MIDFVIRNENRHRPIVGRTRELDTFRGAFERMLAGTRQLVLISGEPGIGKTRCAEAVADVAEDQGSLVLWGRCLESAGAPSYWPWVQILRGYVEASSLDEVRLNMGSSFKEIAALLPELLDASHQNLPAGGAFADSNAARFRTFDAIAQFWQKATHQVPVTLVLDDLHWADAPSLMLLEFLSQGLQWSRLLIVATYRDGDLSRNSPLQGTLGGLGRIADCRRVHLGGLSEAAIAEVAERLSERRLSLPSIQMIYQQTDGNPLFAIELIKVLMDEDIGCSSSPLTVRIPAGVRETIGRRLLRLSDACNDLLGLAAVYGRHFTAGELSLAADLDLRSVLTGLEPAIRAGIVQQGISSTNDFQFTHALIRETLYDELPLAVRLRWHGRAGDALVGIYGADSQRALTRIAHHYYESAAIGHSDQAVGFGLRAAECAVRMCGYEDALIHYDRAIEVLESNGLHHDQRLAQAYVLKGSALRLMGQIENSIDILLEAVNRTRLPGSAELLVDVLMSLAMASQHLAQQHIVPLLEHALSVLPEGDSVPRAKALATLAFAQRTLRDQSRLSFLVDEALDIANRSCDATGRCACYQLTMMALRGNPANLARRILLGETYISLAMTTANPDLLAEGYYWQAHNHIEAGQLDDLESLLAKYEGLSTARFGVHQYWAAAYRVTLGLLRGDYREEAIENLLAIGINTRRDDADGVYGSQMFALNRDLGRLHAMAPQITALASSAGSRMWEPGLMLICADVGMVAEARAIFARLESQEFRGIRRDDMYVTCLVFCAETCCALSDIERAKSLYRLLRPYSGQTANHPTAVCFGAADLYLAMLAATADWPDVAIGHFSAAVEQNRAMRAWPYLARTLFRYGSFLLEHSSPTERRLGAQQLSEAEQLARRLGMMQLISDIDALHVKDHEITLPDDLTTREAEVLGLLAIGRTNKDVALVLTISLNTVATHVRNILNKTQCANRTEAAAYAIRHGIRCDARSTTS